MHSIAVAANFTPLPPKAKPYPAVLTAWHCPWPDSATQTLQVEGRTSIDDDIEAIKKVTVADVNRVAKKYLINDSAVTVIMTPHESGEAVASEGSRSGGESFAPKQTKAVPLPAWAKKALSPLAVL